MTKPRLYQVRVFLKEEFAAAALRGETPAGMQPLMDVLEKHNAKLDHNQLDEFTSFIDVVESHPELETHGTAKRLYDLTKASLANPEKRSYFAREFTVSMNNRMGFIGDAADALIEDLMALGDGPIITRGKAFRPGRTRNVAPVRKAYVPKHHPGT